MKRYFCKVAIAHWTHNDAPKRSADETLDFHLWLTHSGILQTYVIFCRFARESTAHHLRIQVSGKDETHYDDRSGLEK